MAEASILLPLRYRIEWIFSVGSFVDDD